MAAGSSLRRRRPHAIANATRVEMTVIAERAALIAWYERKGYARTGERRPFPPVAPTTTFRPGPLPEMTVLEKRL